MQYRVQAILTRDKDEINFWLTRYWDTVTGLAYHDGDLIVVPNSQELLNINPKSKLDNGSLILTPGRYKELSKKYEVIKKHEVISGRPLTKQEAKEHPIWLKLAQEDKSLLNEYVDAVFTKAKEVYDYDENMGIYLPNDQDKPVMREWYLGDLYYRYGAGASYLDLNNRCLFGVEKQNLDEVLLNILKERKITNPYKLEDALRWYEKKLSLVKLVNQ